METIISQFAANGFVLAVLWWRISRLESRLDRKEEKDVAWHDKLEEVEMRLSNLLSVHNILHPPGNRGK